MAEFNDRRPAQQYKPSPPRKTGKRSSPLGVANYSDPVKREAMLRTSRSSNAANWPPRAL